MIILTMFVTLRLIIIAVNLVQTKQVHIKQFKMFDGEIPQYALNAREHFKNMFEIPILFYVLCIISITTNNYSQTDVNIAWGFAISRLLHTVVRIPNKNVIMRFTFFVIGLFFLGIGWIRFIVNNLH
tara:strand:- start:33 stop:413 length:381 start_codon:yes stop_codon:yes gene_type:complete